MATTATPPTRMKCLITGDGYVGKKCLLARYCGYDLNEYIPTVIDHQSFEMTVDDKYVSLEPFVMSGLEDYDRARPMMYPGTDVFLLCFALNSPLSLENVKSRWYPELRSHCPQTPIVLVGTKSDIRDGKNVNECESKKIISRAEGERMCRDIQADAYTECSALTQEDIHQVFHTAVRAVLERSQKANHVQKKNNCNIS